MNKILVFLSLVFVFAACGDGLTEKVITRYENGQPVIVRFYDKEDHCVREVHYYDDGSVYMEGEIQNNLRHGEWTAYFPDGKVQSTGVYKDGLRIGKSLVYYEHGNLWMDGFYNEDHRCGEWIFYDEQGYEAGRHNYGSCD